MRRSVGITAVSRLRRGFISHEEAHKLACGRFHAGKTAAWYITKREMKEEE
jgi:hypothetical protein